MSNSILDAMLADHRVLTYEEAVTVAKALDILEKHAEGIQHHTAHPQAAQAANIVRRMAFPVGQLLESLLDTGMVAPAGYVPGKLPGTE